MASKVVMPKLSDTMEEGIILKWLKKEGEPVQSGDVIAEIETDKANLEMEAYASGVLRKVVKKEGESAPVGDLIAIIAEPDEDISGLLPGREEAAPKKEAREIERPIPQKKAEEEEVAEPEEIEERAGILASRKGAREAETAVPKREAREAAEAVEGAEEIEKAEEAEKPGRITPPLRAVKDLEMEEVPEREVKASPIARRMAKNLGLDLSQIRGTGPFGRVTKRDIEMFVERREVVPSISPEVAPEVPVAAAPAKFEEKELSLMRKTIAKRMAQSKGPVPHFYITSEIDMEKAMEFRKSMNELEEGLKISFNDLIIKAVAKVLTKYLQINASFAGDKIRIYKEVHIGVAVALEDGLITPVIRNCDTKSLGQIAKESKELAEKARSKKLRPEDYTGGTFTVSNLGMYDVENFAAIINPPEGAILAVSSIQEKPVVVGGQIQVGHRMKVTISCDHRVTDGATAAQFLQELKRVLENPMTLAL